MASCQGPPSSLPDHNSCDTETKATEGIRNTASAVPERTSSMSSVSTAIPYSPTIVLTSTAVSVPSKEDLQLECDMSGYIRESADPGTIKDYLRCPLGTIEYIIQPDDLLLSIDYRCPNEDDKPIKFQLDEDLSKGEALAVYRSERFISYPGCIVDFKIENTVADLMGYTIRQEVVAPLPDDSKTEQQQNMVREICGPEAFGNNLFTSQPIFFRPEGFISGWLSSDPATITLPDGQEKIFSKQFVLIVDNLPYIQVHDVTQKANGMANSWGCWFDSDDIKLVERDARSDYQKKVNANQPAQLFIVGESGFQELDNHE